MGVMASSLPLVLVVDDDEDHAFMLGALLEGDGFSVVSATSRAAGRAILESREVDVLVSDLSLGDGTALDLLVGLDESHRPRAAIVLSGFDSAEDVARSMKAGFDAHLAKPAPLATLRQAISSALGLAPSAVRLAKSKVAPALGVKRSAS